ncbi:hypothetical protein HY375_03865 [Candidatus Berkelbacteria bacterium]|nr:hypothetical protein [Candidatus Berkelbacteria bacterium]
MNIRRFSNFFLALLVGLAVHHGLVGLLDVEGSREALRRLVLFVATPFVEFPLPFLIGASLTALLFWVFRRQLERQPRPLRICVAVIMVLVLAFLSFFGSIVLELGSRAGVAWLDGIVGYMLESLGWEESVANQTIVAGMTALSFWLLAVLVAMLGTDADPTNDPGQGAVFLGYVARILFHILGILAVGYGFQAEGIGWIMAILYVALALVVEVGLARMSRMMARVRQPQRPPVQAGEPPP